MLYNGLKDRDKEGLNKELLYREEKIKRITSKSKQLYDVKLNIMELQKDVFKHFSLIKNKDKDMNFVLESICNIKEINDISLDKLIGKSNIIKEEDKSGLKKIFFSNKKSVDKLDADKRLIKAEIERLENIEYRFIDKRKSLIELYDNFNNTFNDIINCYPNDYDLFNKGQIKIAMEFLNNIKALSNKIDEEIH
ncbi:hypothetical protein WG909_07700 [Peptostreptococcaceae bacterium AGR-M142]